MDDNVGSVDYDPDGYRSPTYNSWAEELYYRVKEVLKEYYGDNWETNPEAKVILIGHSTGGLAIREMLRVYPDIVSHIEKVITADTPHQGSPWATWGEKETFFWLLVYAFLPLWDPVPEFEFETYRDVVTGELRLVIQAANPQAVALVLNVWVEELISAGFSVFTPVGADLARPIMGQNPFLRGLNSSPLPYIDKGYSCVIGNKFFDDLIGIQNISNLIVLGVEGWVATYVTIAVTRAFTAFSTGDVVNGIKYTAIALMKAASGIWWYNFVFNSDAIVWEDSQNLRKVYPDRTDVYIEPLEDAWHCGIQQHTKAILNAVESPPVIDSVFLVEIDTLNNNVDTTFLRDFYTTGKIDTIVADPQNCSIHFKLNNVYFLYQTGVSINLNGMPLGSLAYPEYKGYNDRWCKIPPRYLMYLGGGMNKLTIEAKNIEGQKTSKTYYLWIVPSGWHVRPWWPDHRKVLSDFKPYQNFKLFIVKLGLDTSQMNIAWDTLKIQPAYAKLDSEGKWYFQEDSIYVINRDDYTIDTLPSKGFIDPNTGDTLSGKYLSLPRISIMNYLDKDNNGYVDEGAYRFFYSINDGDKTISFVTGFYIDKTPPIISIKSPSGIINDTTLFVSFIANDNLEEEIMTPDSFSIEIYKGKIEEIYKGEHSETIYETTYVMIYDTTFSVYYYNDYWWDNLPLNLQDGSYLAIIKMVDRAGNYSQASSFFQIDKRPPNFVVIQKMDTILSSENPFTEFKIEPDEYSIGEISVFKEGDSIPSYSQKFYGEKDETLEIFLSTSNLEDGFYNITFTLSDSAGNDSVLNKDIFMKGERLRVDKTSPEIVELTSQPLITDGMTFISFKVSQIKDILQNRGKIRIKCFLDTLLFMKDSTEGDTSSFNSSVSLFGLGIGRHNIKVLCEDDVGNTNFMEFPVFFRSGGVKLIEPVNSDTLLKGIIGIRGIVNDPDAFNDGGFKDYGLYWKTEDGYTPGIPVPGEWHSEYLNAIGEVSNKGFSKFQNPSIIGYFNTDSLNPGFYTLLLIGNDSSNAFLYDTARVYISNEKLEEPDICFSLKITGGDNVLNKDESLFVRYGVKNILSDFDIKITDRYGNIVSYGSQKGVKPLYGKPLNMTEGGFYIYEVGDTLFIHHNGKEGASFLTINFQEGETIFVYDSIGFEGDNNFVFVGNNLILYLSDTTVDECLLKVKRGDYYTINSSEPVFSGEKGYPIKYNDIIGARPFLWTGRIFPSGAEVGTGWYKIRVSAIGENGGFKESTDSVYVENEFRVDSVWILPEVISISDNIPVNVYIKANMDSRVIWSLEDSVGNFVVTNQNGGVIYRNGKDYFTVYLNNLNLSSGLYTFWFALSPVFGDTGVLRTKNIKILGDTIFPASDSELYIPERYRVLGEIFNGKPEYKIRAFPNGMYHPPVKYIAYFSREGYAFPDTVKWKIIYGNLVPDSIVRKDTIRHNLPYTSDTTQYIYLIRTTNGWDITIWHDTLYPNDRIHVETVSCLIPIEGPEGEIYGYEVGKGWMIYKNDSLIWLTGCSANYFNESFIIERYIDNNYYFNRFDSSFTDTGSVVIRDTNAVVYDYSCFCKEPEIKFIPKPDSDSVCLSSGKWYISNPYYDGKIDSISLSSPTCLMQVDTIIIDTIITCDSIRCDTTIVNNYILRIKTNGGTILKTLYADRIMPPSLEKVEVFKEDSAGGVNYFKLYINDKMVYQGFIGEAPKRIQTPTSYVSIQSANFFKTLEFEPNMLGLKKGQYGIIPGYLEVKDNNFESDTFYYSKIFKEYLPLSSYYCSVSGDSCYADTSGDTVIIRTNKNCKETNWTGIKDDRLFFTNGFLETGENLLFPPYFPSNGLSEKIHFKDIYTKMPFGFSLNYDFVSYITGKKEIFNINCLGNVPIHPSRPSDDTIIHNYGDCGLVYTGRKDLNGFFKIYKNDSLVDSNSVVIHGGKFTGNKHSYICYKEGDKYILKEYSICKNYSILDSFTIWERDTKEITGCSLFFIYSEEDSVGKNLTMNDSINLDLMNMLKKGEKRVSLSSFCLDTIFPPDSYIVYIGDCYISGSAKFNNSLDNDVHIRDGELDSIFDKLDFSGGTEGFGEDELLNKYIFYIEYLPSAENLYKHKDTSFVSNPNLFVTSWDSFTVYNIKGDTSRDVEIFEIDTSGYGRGEDDYFIPGIKLSMKSEEWLPIMGRSDKRYRLFAYNNGKWFNLSDGISPPCSTTLGFLPSSEVAGKVTFYLYQYNNNDEIDRILKKDFYIGDIVDTNSQIVSSPFGRVTLQFPNDPSLYNTLWNIETHLPQEIELGGLSPYIPGTFSPIVRFIPGNYKPKSQNNAPTIVYRFSFRDIKNNNIDTANIDLYGYGDDGEIRKLNAFHSFSDSIFELLVSGEIYPLDMNLAYIGVLKDDSTVKGKISLFYPQKIKKDSIKITGIANTIPSPESLTFQILAFCLDKNKLTLSGNKNDTLFYKGMNLMKIYKEKRKFLSRLPDTTLLYYEDEFTTDENGYFEKIIPLSTGKRYWIYCIAKSFKGKDVSNSPTGFLSYLDKERDSLILSVIGDTNKVITDTFNTYLYFKTNKPAIIHYLRNINGEFYEIGTFSVNENETLSIEWNGTDEFGYPLINGIYEYRAYATDENNSSNEIRGYWDIKRTAFVNIILPDKKYLSGYPYLLAKMENYPFVNTDWFYMKNDTSYFIGTQTDENIPVFWNTLNINEGEYLLIAKLQEPHIGSNSKLIVLDKSRPFSNILFSSPYYYDQNRKKIFINSQTSISITGEDNLSGISDILFSIDGDSFERYISPFNFGGLDGNHRITFYAIDSAGNSEIPKDTFFYLDNTPPYTYLEFGASSRIYNDTLYISPSESIKVVSIDTIDVMASYYAVYTMDGNLVQDWKEGDCFLLPTVSGIYYYRISYYSKDFLGNTSLPQDTFFCIDINPPITNIEIGTPKYVTEKLYLTSQTPITLIASDDISGVRCIRFKIGDGEWIEVDSSIASFNVTGMDGEYIIQYYSIDNAGNNEDIKNITISLDNTPPLSSLEIGEPKYISDKSYVKGITGIKISVIDEGCGVEYSEYRIDNGEWISYNNSATFDLSSYQDGLHKIFKRSRDFLGNEEGIDSLSVALDNTSTISSLNIGEPKYVFNDSIIILSVTPCSLSAYDPLINGVASGLSSISYRITPNNDWITILDSIITFEITGDDGSYIVDYKSSDNLNNEEIIHSKSLILDNKQPFCEIISPLDSTFVNTQIGIIGTVQDEHFDYYYVEYGIGENPDEWILIKPETHNEVIDGLLTYWDTSFLPEGIYTVRVIAYDVVGNRGEDRVLLIVGKPQFEFEITGFNKCEGVDVDNNGFIYVAESNPSPQTEHNRIAKFDPLGNWIMDIKDGNKPNNVAIDSFGNIYVTAWAGNCMTKYSPEGDSLMRILGFNKPDGVAIDKFGNIFIADQNNNRILKYDKDGNLIFEIGGLLHPEGVAIDTFGNIYTTEAEGNKVKKYDPEGHLLFEFGNEGTGPGEFIRPSDITVERNGNIWVVDRNNDRIQMFDKFGNLLFVFGTTGNNEGEFNKPEGISLKFGKIFIADRNNDRIQVFTFPSFTKTALCMMKGDKKDNGLEIKEAVNFPNPFNPNRERTKIRIVLTKDAELKIKIYNFAGKIVWEYKTTGFEGINEIEWDGRNEIGEIVNNGVYNFVVKAINGNEKKEAWNKIAVIK